ncbi:ATP-dependent NAD(P)H-hydrate dehydratase [Malassezia cuniculi]|uniref:ATP-dependent NAD(P)H-hydrate dehydratase n=1 Tax=Malassezia cuniculi TaxID=948313 RepID=A0AAF0JCX1_9BASI|nr:ATP-dependent NAD(P)H-hydrate dehydratase [Malassezia cuniculi]
MASMRLGCDMSFTVCDPVAAPTIKGYSPDVIVHPILDAARSPADVRTDLDALCARLHSLVIGPGLGREAHMQAFAQVAIEVARARGIYLVLDADALWLIQNNPAAIKGYGRAVLTPNVVEFGRLCDAVGVDRTQHDTAVMRLAEALDGPTILAKGRVDEIVSPACVAANSGSLKCEVQGGLKRCGGQGDVLAGSLGTMLAWAQRYEERQAQNSSVVGVDGKTYDPVPFERLPLVAAYGASMVARTVSP